MSTKFYWNVRHASHKGTAHFFLGSVFPSIRLYLRPSLLTDDRLEIAHNRREGVRANCGGRQVVGVVDIGYTISHGLVHGIFQLAASVLNRHHLIIT